MTDEFERQMENLVRLGYSQSDGLSDAEFRRKLEPLRTLQAEASAPGGSEGRIPFAIVARNGVIPPERAIALVASKDGAGFTSMDAGDIARFVPPSGLDVPDGLAYLLTDIDTGGATLNVTPDDALVRIAADKRSPLTLDEGIAVLIHYPDVLRSHNCFSMLGSRCGDRRVTALWVSAGRPRLGWCWAGNPHTWLGSASCGARLGC